MEAATEEAMCLQAHYQILQEEAWTRGHTQVYWVRERIAVFPGLSRVMTPSPLWSLVSLLSAVGDDRLLKEQSSLRVRRFLFRAQVRVVGAVLGYCPQCPARTTQWSFCP